MQAASRSRLEVMPPAFQKQTLDILFNMKRTNILAIVVIILAIGAIALIPYNKDKSAKRNLSSVIMEKIKDKRVLVLFYSRAGDNYKVGRVNKGNTAFLAEHISHLTNADIFEITSQKNYDIPYTEMLQVVREEWENDEYPAFSKPLHDIDKYDIIFVGGPIWWGTYPRVMFSFFKEHNLDEKIIIPFTTNEGSGLGNTKVDLQRFFPKAMVMDGFSMSGQEARKPEAYETVRQWLDGLDFQDKQLTDNGDIDGVTTATTINSQLTEKGQECEKQIKKVLDIKFQDGRFEKRELIIKGVVDMGLGTLWSATNLGADFAWETGSHYAWGETKTKQSYVENNYTYYRQVIGNDISKTWHDAAQQELGGDWRMPTKDEWHELLFSVEHEWVSIQGHQGYLFTAKNGEHLFFPANGYRYDQNVGTPDEGYYWTSTSSNIDNAYVTYLPSNSWGISNYGRYIGIGIRPVK